MAEKIGTGIPTPGRMVTMHTSAGSFPAVVTRVNPNDSLNLTVFTSGDILYRFDVEQWAGDEENEGEVDEVEKVGYWEWPEKV